MPQKSKLKICLLIALMASFLLSAVVHAQVPRPTPTNEARVPTNVPSTDSSARGTIRGSVYQDVNGDGKCVDTGVAGEGPVQGVNIEFVSSDKATVITLYSGDDGTYGLVAVGQSYWGVTAKPGAQWVVTSQKTLYAPVYPDNLVVTGINFCVQKATSAKVVFLPQSGAPANPLLSYIAFIGIGFIALGVGLQLRPRRQA